MHFQTPISLLLSSLLTLSPVLASPFTDSLTPRHSKSSLSWTTYLNPAYPVHSPGNNFTFSPTTITLITGPHSAVLVDTPLSTKDAETVSAWITTQLAPKNITLKYIYITHGHGDHFFGLPTIIEHFPSVEILATPGTIAHAKDQLLPAEFDSFWGPLFPGQIAPQTETWTALPADGKFELDGFELGAVEVGQTDTYNTTVLHVPSLSLVVAGDAVYGSCFQYLAESTTPALRGEWLKALVEIEKLGADWVVPSHRQEWDGFGFENLARTREYLRNWEVEILDTAALGLKGDEGKDELKRRVGAIFPERIGDFIFEISAEAAFPVNGTS